jgi:hypothetical protein
MKAKCPYLGALISPPILSNTQDHINLEYFIAREQNKKEGRMERK